MMNTLQDESANSVVDLNSLKSQYEQQQDISLLFELKTHLRTQIEDSEDGSELHRYVESELKRRHSDVVLYLEMLHNEKSIINKAYNEVRGALMEIHEEDEDGVQGYQGVDSGLKLEKITKLRTPIDHKEELMEFIIANKLERDFISINQMNLNKVYQSGKLTETQRSYLEDLVGLGSSFVFRFVNLKNKLFGTPKKKEPRQFSLEKPIHTPWIPLDDLSNDAVEILNHRESKIYCNPSIFKPEERLAIQEWGALIEALISGEVDPFDRLSQELVDHWDGNKKPSSPVVFSYWKMMKRSEIEKSLVSSDKIEISDPSEAWFSRRDYYRMRNQYNG